MKHPDHLKMRSLLLACCLAAAYPAAHAEETSTTTPTTTSTSTTSITTTAVGASSNTEAKLSAEFAEFLGGTEQADAVVSGLRQGTAFSLDAASNSTGTTGTTNTTGSSTTGTSPSTTTTTTIDPPTGSMGYGNVRITLRLAQAQLNQMGITQPTAEELSAVLLGGEINGTRVDGILTMRADGMGWGQIAKEYGMTVGQLMGKGAGLTKQATTLETKTTPKAGAVSSATTKSGQARSNGYISSSPKSASASTARSNGYIPSGSGKTQGVGMVSAAGGSLGSSGQGNGKGQTQNKITTSAQGAGMVSAGGQHVSMSGVSNAGGGSKAMASGQLKKN